MCVEPVASWVSSIKHLTELQTQRIKLFYTNSNIRVINSLWSYTSSNITASKTFHLSLNPPLYPPYSRDMDWAMESRALTSEASWHSAQAPQNQIVRQSLTNDPGIPFCSLTLPLTVAAQMMPATGTNVTAPQSRQLSPTFSATLPATIQGQNRVHRRALQLLQQPNKLFWNPQSILG